MDKGSDIVAGDGWAFLVMEDYSIRFGRDFDWDMWWDSPNNSITLNNWWHVVVSYNEDSNSNDPDMYINGELQVVDEPYGSVTGSAVSDASQTLLIGGRTVGADLSDFKPAAVAGVVPALELLLFDCHESQPQPVPGPLRIRLRRGQ